MTHWHPCHSTSGCAEWGKPHPPAIEKVVAAYADLTQYPHTTSIESRLAHLYLACEELTAHYDGTDT